MNKEEILYEKLYKDTQNCGRTQFVKLLQSKEIKLNETQKENKVLKKRIDKAIEYLKNIEYIDDYIEHITFQIKQHDSCLTSILQEKE